MIITSLVDDYCPRRGLGGEHGLSLLVEAGGRTVLLDAGQDDLLIRNARALEMDLRGLDAVVLSHGHYDHGGGLAALFEELAGEAPPLYAGPGHTDRRLSRSEERVVDIGLALPFLPPTAFPPLQVDALEALGGGLFILPKAEALDGSEPSTRFRRVVGDLETVDAFDDELSLVVVEEEGISVIAGCAHRGIGNIAREALAAFPGRPLRALVGGFHLADRPQAELARIAEDLAALAPSFIHCGHCTGPRGYAALAARFGDRAAWLHCGSRIHL